MAIFHLSVKTISRSAGRSATAAIAYRTGSRIADERTGLVHDYTRRSGVEHSEIFLPSDTPEWASHRESLWNAVEQKENRRNSTVAREFEIAFPSELDGKQRLDLLREFCGSLVERHGMAVDAAIHSPGKEGDQRNYHAHVLCSTRRLTAGGFTDKTRELDDFKSGEVSQWREAWARMTNHHLEKAGLDERIDHRSLEAQHAVALSLGDNEKAARLERLPTIHIGHTAAHMEKRGIATDRGNEQRQIVLKNNQIRTLSRGLDMLEGMREKIRAAAAPEKGSPASSLERRQTALAKNHAPPAFARGRLRTLSDLETLDIDNRSGLSRQEERAESGASHMPSPEKTGPAKPISPELVRLEWQNQRRDKLAYVQKKAGRIAARGAAQVERQREKISSHEQIRPEQPAGLMGMFKRSAYEQASSAWKNIKDGLDRRLLQLKNRLSLVRGYMRKSGSYETSSPGERLADTLAARDNPALAGQVKALDTQKKAQEQAAYRSRIQARKQERTGMKQETIEELKQRGDARRDKADKAERAELEKASHLASLQNETLSEEKKEQEQGNKPGLSKRDQLLEKFRNKADKDRQNERGGRGR